MKKIEFSVGREYQYQGQTVIFRRTLDLRSVLVENKQSGALIKAPIQQLHPLEVELPENTVTKDDLLNIEEKEWEKAQQRLEAIKPILVNRGNLKIVQEVAKKNKVSISTIYRWVQFFETTESVVSLVENKKGGGKGRSRVAPEIDFLIKQAIEEHYLTAQRRTVIKVIIEVKKLCRNAGLKSPGDNTIRRRVQQISEQEKIRRRFGKKAATHQFEETKGNFPDAKFPLSVVQIDHTLVDIQLVDETYRKTIGRPWLTMAIDVYSRMVVGLYLSYDPPGSIGTGLCIAHSILPKEIWLSKLDLQAEWPCWGVMRTIHLDNAREFKSMTLKRACEKYNINLDWRPVATPNYGGHIERLMGTFMAEVHDLAGTTFSNAKERGKYPSEKKAALTLAEFETWLITFITEVYHMRVHSGLNKPPIDVYQDGIFGNAEQPGIGLPERIYEEAQVRLDFMPAEERTIQDYGVAIDHIHYFDDVLRKYINSILPGSGKARIKQKFTFKRDPRDISSIYFLDPETELYYKIPYRDTSRPSISFWEHKDAIKRLKDAGRENIDEDAIFEAYDKMRKIELDAVAKTRKINKTRNRMIESSNTTTISYHSGEKILSNGNHVDRLKDNKTNKQPNSSGLKKNFNIKPFDGLDDE